MPQYFRSGFAILCMLLISTQVPAQAIQWLREVGNSGHAIGGGVSADGLGNVYTAGYTNSLGGSSGTNDDAFVSKYDVAGSLLWIRQLGSSDNDFNTAVSADGLGNVYTSGYTYGDLGGANAGFTDAFVSKYDSFGNLIWIRQLGSSADDLATGVSADGLGNAYTSGYTNGALGATSGNTDAFVSKYDASGNLIWIRQLGTNEIDSATGVSAENMGNVYVTGSTFGSLGGTNAGLSDAFLSKYDSAGNLLWTRQFGTSNYDVSQSVSADGLGNVYIAGDTAGNLAMPNAGSHDAFLGKFDTAGNLLWIRQFGTEGGDVSYGVSADRLGNVYISGYTYGNLDGANAGSTDAFVSKYDASGNFMWTRQLGTDRYDYGNGASADGLGNAYFSGQTFGSLGGARTAGSNAFVVKLSDVPEPSSLALLALLVSCCCAIRGH